MDPLLVRESNGWGKFQDKLVKTSPLLWLLDFLCSLTLRTLLGNLFPSFSFETCPG